MTSHLTSTPAEKFRPSLGLASIPSISGQPQRKRQQRQERHRPHHILHAHQQKAIGLPSVSPEARHTCEIIGGRAPAIRSSRWDLGSIIHRDLHRGDLD